MAERATTTTILFSDLIDSSPLLERQGDERAKRVIDAHHRLLSDAVSANAGQEVKWTGDGVMAAFGSAADAVRCAIAMQRTARRPVRGERLKMRVGLNVGEVLRKGENDYFGAAVVLAQRLCAKAEDGQIVCSALVAGLLAGRQAFNFRDMGVLDLKGIAAPVTASEVLYGRERSVPLVSPLLLSPFVGREAEIARLEAKLTDAAAGRGALAMLVGEPGIGKTRTIEEFAGIARDDGATVLWGRSFEGEWQPPYGPFAEALAAHFKAADPDELLADLGYGAAPIARLVPSLRERLPDIREPEPLQPDEERFRLLDAVSQFLIATSRRATIVLVLDDLHWADRGTFAMLRHVARFAATSRILVIGAYRDVELDRQHPLADALAALRREADYDRLLLRGLDEDDVGRLLSSISEEDVPAAFIKAISDETVGNPFFVRSIVQHLIEDGKVYREDGQWKSSLRSIAELGIPEGVRQVIGRRLSRLSDEANKMLSAASAFNGAVRIDVVAGVAGLDERASLDAVDEALAAQLLRSAGEPDACDFTHALIRHMLYAELTPPRQVRLHRAVAETMERVYGDQAPAHAAEIAYHYHRSATLPGAERGVVHALAAADQHEAAYAWDEAVTFLRIALELLPDQDMTRPRILGRLGIALAWALDYDAAVTAASEAGELVAHADGDAAAADFLKDAAYAIAHAGGDSRAWPLAAQGLRHIGARRDGTWCWLTYYDLGRRDFEDPAYGGIRIDSPQLRELRQVIDGLSDAGLPQFITRFGSRAALLSHGGDDPGHLGSVGEFGRALAGYEALAARAEAEGRISAAVMYWGQASALQVALGSFGDAHAARQRGVALSPRLTGPTAGVFMGLGVARAAFVMATGEGYEGLLRDTEQLASAPAAEYNFAIAAIRLIAAAAHARLGHVDEAMRWLATGHVALERGSARSPQYETVVCLAAEVLWALARTDYMELIERSLLEKVLVADYRNVVVDGRQAMGRVSALQGRLDEAIDWFAQARVVLDEQGARPLRAIVDYDEALMYTRRTAAGDAECARPLLDAALAQFREIGMTGWVKRAEVLREGLGRSAP